MPTVDPRQHAVSRSILAVFAAEIALWLLWSNLLNRGPLALPGLEPMTEAVLALVGCESLGCLPYVFASTAVYLYLVAVPVGNLLDFGRERVD